MDSVLSSQKSAFCVVECRAPAGRHAPGCHRPHHFHSLHSFDVCHLPAAGDGCVHIPCKMGVATCSNRSMPG